MPNHPKSVLVTAYKGLNNVLAPESTPRNFLKKALNIDIDKSGGITKRQGFTLKDTGNYTSLWASEKALGCYGVKDGNLININPDYSSSIIKSNVGSLKFSFEEVDDIIYYTSHNFNGIIKNNISREWGIEKNHLSPTLSIGTGTLPVGSYQVTFTYVNSSGIESGAPLASIIAVPNNSGISLFIPTNTNTEITHARIYCSTQNGSTLYYSGIGLLGTNYNISSQDNLINPLITSNLDRPPLGQIVKYYRGRLYIASANILYYTEPFMYEHIDFSKNYIEFPEYIREVMPVEDGIWIGSDKIYYLSGEDADKFKLSTKEHVKVVEGSSVLFTGSYLHIDNTPVGYKWFVTTNEGIFILFNQGLIINMTAANVAMDRSDIGTATFLQQRGMNHYLSILKNNDKLSNSVMGDLAEATIIRNGVVIP